jgi:hypothetical protein
MVTRIDRLSRIMKASWDIQRRKNCTRAKSLQSAWAIFSNEDVTVFYLVRKLNHNKPVANKVTSQMGLFIQ